MKRTILILMVAGWAMFGYSSALGEEYGGPLDSAEEQAMAETLQNALEYNKTSQESSWVNPDTGRSGATVPVKTYVNDEGLYCREYLQTILIGGEQQQGYGTACRQADGSWRIMSGEEATYQARMAGNPSYVYVVRDPSSGYYPWVYYEPSYYPFPIFFSFVFERHGGHFHHGHFHHGHRFFKGDHFRGGGHNFRIRHGVPDRRHFGTHDHWRGHHFRSGVTIRHDHGGRGKVIVGGHGKFGERSGFRDSHDFRGRGGRSFDSGGHFRGDRGGRGGHGRR